MFHGSVFDFRSFDIQSIYSLISFFNINDRNFISNLQIPITSTSIAVDFLKCLSSHGQFDDNSGKSEYYQSCISKIVLSFAEIEKTTLAELSNVILIDIFSSNELQFSSEPKKFEYLLEILKIDRSKIPVMQIIELETLHPKYIELFLNFLNYDEAGFDELGVELLRKFKRILLSIKSGEPSVILPLNTEFVKESTMIFEIREIKPPDSKITKLSTKPFWVTAFLTILALGYFAFEIVTLEIPEENRLKTILFSILLLVSVTGFSHLRSFGVYTGFIFAYLFTAWHFITLETEARQFTYYDYPVYLISFYGFLFLYRKLSWIQIIISFCICISCHFMILISKISAIMILFVFSFFALYSLKFSVLNYFLMVVLDLVLFLNTRNLPFYRRWTYDQITDIISIFTR